uniref:GNAT family N-acetyltransferase n=1 Tax=Thaumasiovibrio occultus TaxID=1891184 RepID=UPI000B362DE7|nr:GNAT family N-acetyltransferase [Thaumasiovibrio occultus]
MKVSLLSASATTFSKLFKLVDAFFAHEELDHDVERTQAALHSLASRPEMGRIWLIEVEQDDETHLVGHLVVSFSFSLEVAGRVAIVDQFYLDPHWRSQGVGTYVIPAIENALTNEGISQLSMEVNIGNGGARRFYERMGYNPRRQHCIMSKNLVLEPADLDMVS